MLISVTTLLVALASIFRSRASLELENLALRHQIGVLQRSARKLSGLTVLRENVVRFEPFSNQQHSKVESEAFLDRDQDVTMLHRCRKCPIEFLVGTIGSGTKKSNADFAMTYERTTARY